MTKRLLWGVAVLSMAAGVAAAEPDRGSKAPAFTARDLGGKSVSLSSYKGKGSVLLAFWSTECLISASEVNQLQKDLRGFTGKPITALGVVIDRRTAAQVSAWAKQHKVTMRSLLDADRKMLKSYGISMTPTYVLIDKQGVVQARYVGSNKPIRQALVADIRDLLEGGSTPEPEVRPAIGGG